MLHTFPLKYQDNSFCISAEAPKAPELTYRGSKVSGVAGMQSRVWERASAVLRVPSPLPKGKKSRRCLLLHLGPHQPSPEGIHWNLLTVSLQCRSHSSSVPTGWADTLPLQQSEGEDRLHPVPKVKHCGSKCQRKAGGASPLVPHSPRSMAFSRTFPAASVRWGPWRTQCPEKRFL